MRRLRSAAVMRDLGAPDLALEGFFPGALGFQEFFFPLLELLVQGVLAFQQLVEFFLWIHRAGVSGRGARAAGRGGPERGFGAGRLQRPLHPRDDRRDQFEAPLRQHSPVAARLGVHRSGADPKPCAGSGILALGVHA